LTEQTLALPDSQGYAKPLFKMMTKKFPIPKVLSISEFTGIATELRGNFSKDGFLYPAGTTRAGCLFQTCKTTFFKTMDPVLNSTGAVAEKLCDFVTAEAVTDQQDSMEAMVIPGFLGSHDFLLNSYLHYVCCFYFQSTHAFFLSAISIAKTWTMRKYLCRYI
jgi:hypothetical protein